MNKAFKDDHLVPIFRALNYTGKPISPNILLEKGMCPPHKAIILQILK